MTEDPMRRLWDHVAGCPQCTPRNSCPAAKALVRQVRDAGRAKS